MQCLVVLTLVVSVVYGHMHAAPQMDSSYEYIQPAAFLRENELSNYEWKNIRERMADAENLGEIPIITEGKLKVAGGSDKGNVRFKPNGEAVKPPQKAKVDNLPKYCDPPNPCPAGKTTNDGCQTDVQDSEVYNRNWILEKQSRGECPCDREHMKSCDGHHTVSSGVEVDGTLAREINKMLRNAIKDREESVSSDSIDDSEQMMDIQIPEDAKVVAKKGTRFVEDMEDMSDESDMDDMRQ